MPITLNVKTFRARRASQCRCIFHTTLRDVTVYVRAGIVLTIAWTAVAITGVSVPVLGWAAHASRDYTPLNPQAINITGSFPGGARMTQLQAVLQSERDWLDYVLVAAGVLPMSTVVVVVLVLISRLVKTAREGDPFVDANVRRLMTMGWILTIAVPIVVLAGDIVDMVRVARLDLPSGLVQPAFDLGPALWPVIMGLTVLALSYAFAVGTGMRSEMEGLV